MMTMEASFYFLISRSPPLFSFPFPIPVSLRPFIFIFLSFFFFFSFLFIPLHNGAVILLHGNGVDVIRER